MIDKGIKAICFDIDGTLYPDWQTNLYVGLSFLSAPFFALKYNNARKEIRKADGFDLKDPLKVEDFRAKEFRYMGGSSYASYLANYEKKLLKPWNRNIKLLSKYAYVEETLKLLKDKGYVLGALSDFPLSNKLEILGLDKYFSYTASCEDCGFLKPNPTPLVKMASDMGFKTEEIIYVGNSYRKDIVGSNRANIKAIHIPAKKSETKHYFPNWKKFYNFVVGEILC